MTTISLPLGLQTLPPEVLNLIFNQCRIQDLFQLTCISKSWKKFIDNSESWRIIAQDLSLESAGEIKECKEKIRIYYSWNLSEQEIKILALASTLHSTRASEYMPRELFSACYAMSVNKPEIFKSSEHNGHGTHIKRCDHPLELIKIAISENPSKNPLRRHIAYYHEADTKDKILSGCFSIKDGQLRSVGLKLSPSANAYFSNYDFPPPKATGDMPAEKVADELEALLARLARVLNRDIAHPTALIAPSEQKQDNSSKTPDASKKRSTYIEVLKKSLSSVVAFFCSLVNQIWNRLSSIFSKK